MKKIISKKEIEKQFGLIYKVDNDEIWAGFFMNHLHKVNAKLIGVNKGPNGWNWDAYEIFDPFNKQYVAIIYGHSNIPFSDTLTKNTAINILNYAYDSLIEDLAIKGREAFDNKYCIYNQLGVSENE